MSEPLLQVLDPAGASVGEAPEIPRDDLRRLFRHMLKMRVLDQRMLSLQRQGRIGFYGTATGQEASVTGGACAWRDTDWVFPALREMGVALWRGTTIQEIVCQLIGNSGDVLIGRQMPCHFSDRRVRTVAWSSVIGTQLPHAMGAAWASKLLGDGAICIGYLGDGATSAGDFHAAANFAGVFKLPLVFFCQNNQWAISVPLSRQTASASIAIKASAYGFPGVRVDGNDILAVIAAARAAAERARRGEGPTLLECLTYRTRPHAEGMGDFTYRTKEEVEGWKKNDPILLWGRRVFDGWAPTRDRLVEIDAAAQAEVDDAIRFAEESPWPDPATACDHVYSTG